MFWKLCKFEWKSSYRMYGMFYAILLICSVLIGMSSLPDVNLPGLVEFLINLTIIIYTAGIFAVNIITIVFIFRNYMKTMYGRQSYLTHTFDLADTDGKGFVRIVMDFLDLRCYYGNGLDYDDIIRCKCSQRCH